MQESLRIDELESRLAFQDNTIAALNDALVQQQQRIDHLQKLLEMVLEQIRGSSPDIDLPVEEGPPPHF